MSSMASRVRHRADSARRFRARTDRKKAAFWVDERQEEGELVGGGPAALVDHGEESLGERRRMIGFAHGLTVAISSRRGLQRTVRAPMERDGVATERGSQ